MTSLTLLRRSALGLLLFAALSVSACGAVSGGAVPPQQAPGGERLGERALRSLEDQRSELLDGGVPGFEKRIAALDGYPVVVNQWASWCGPCRAEFPFFQRLAAKYRGEIAFLGVDSQDARPDAEQFLDELSTPFPHYFDPDAEIARSFGGGRAWPTTAFYTADGEVSFVHQGAYATEAKLDEDIRRYALGG